MSESILVIEDNKRLRKFIVSSLEKHGYESLEADSSKSAYEHLKNSYMDLVLLDLKLGEDDGIDILQTIRRQDEYLPVIIVSSIHDRDIKLDGFEIGCDDYITKPFYVDELIGRVRRIIKRSKGIDRAPAPIYKNIDSGPFHLDVNALKVYKNGTEIHMRKKLFDIFLHLVRHPDTVFSIDQLHGYIWDSSQDVSENSFYVHIRQLRKLVEDDPSRPMYIKTIRNVGYLFSVGK